MKSFHTRKAGTVKIPVKNLGWLLRHWKDVHHFVIGMGKQTKAPFMCALFKDGEFYYSDWADITVMFRWLNRPIFKGLTVNVLPLTTGSSYWYEIGTQQWKRYQELPHPFFMSEVFGVPLDMKSQCCKAPIVPGSAPMSRVVGQCSKCGIVSNIEIPGATQLDILKYELLLSR